MNKQNRDLETTILLVDDHEVFRMGLNLLVAAEADLRVVGEAGDGQTAVDRVRELAPDVVIMDINMPDMDGIEATQKIIAEFPQTKIVALSIHAEGDYVARMLRAGASGYVLKENAPEDLVMGVRAVQRSEIFLSDSIEEVVLAQFLENLAENAPQNERDIHDSLLTTKFHHPRIAGRTIRRDRLLAQMRVGLMRPLTLVSAPAGYGKSTLVGQWLESSDYVSAWLSLDEHDNDLRLFLTYLVAAVRTQYPEAMMGSATLLEATKLPPMRILASMLVNDLERLPRRLVLVLDDYHRIVERTIHELLADVLQHPPRTLHLVLVSRTDPALDLLRMRAYRQMGEVRAQALSFTVEETAAYLESVVGSAVEARIAQEITRKTEGWVTGLHLITLSVRDSAELDSLSTVMPGELQTLDYLASEALARQPRDIQDWLLKTSILVRFCASLCEAVCEAPESVGVERLGGEDFIRWLSDSNLFVIQLDRQGLWFRYHHLFQELLKNQVENVLGDEELADLNIRASQWFDQNGLIEEAIQHALQAGDIDGAARIVEQNRHAVQDRDRWFVLEKWLSLLPEEVKERRPGLLMARVWLSFEQYDFVAILSDIERIERILGNDQSNEPLWGEVNFCKGYFEYFSGQGARSIDYFERALNLIPKSQQHNRSETELHYMLALQMVGRKQEALQELSHWLQTRQNVSDLRRTRYLAGLYYIHLLDGNLSDVTYSARRLQDISSESGFLYAESWGVYGQAMVSLLQNDQAKANEYLSWLAGKRYIMHAREGVDSFCAFAVFEQMSQQDEEAVEASNLLLDFAQDANDPAVDLVAKSCQARLALLQGDLPSAWRWLQTADLTSDQEIMLWWFEIPRITACRVLVAEGSSENLERAIENLLAYLEENQALNHFYQVIVMLPLLALAYSSSGQENLARQTLEEALRLAMPGSWVWPFIELGTPMAALLNRLKLQGIDSDLSTYADQILTAFPMLKPDHTGGEDHDLTERELQVLRLLATVLSIQEIADQLVVSINTVRMHTKNVYSKLDVHSRIEAVQRGCELGLI